MYHVFSVPIPFHWNDNLCVRASSVHLLANASAHAQQLGSVLISIYLLNPSQPWQFALFEHKSLHSAGFAHLNERSCSCQPITVQSSVQFKNLQKKIF